MHNCKTAHPKKSHRRRNRFLKRTLVPLYFPGGWGSSEPGTAHEGTGVLQKGVIETIGSLFSPSSHGSPTPLKREGRVQICQPSAIRRLATGMRRAMPFTRRRSG